MPKNRNQFEQSTKLARRAVESHFKKRAGEAIIAATVPELIRTVPCSSGISSEAMIGALRQLKREGSIKVKTRRPAGPTRIKLTGRGRSALGT